MTKTRGGVLLELPSLDRGGPVPLYRQLYTQVRAQILTGKLAPGDRLPSSETLAKSVGISRITVRTAFDLLVDEGLLLGQVGHGSIVPWDLPSDMTIRTLENKPRAPVDRDVDALLSMRGANTMANSTYGATRVRAFEPTLPALDLFPRKIWARLTSQVWRHDDSSMLCVGAPGGDMALRAAIARQLALTRHIECEPEQVILTCGALNSLRLVAELLLDRGDIVWVEDPGIVSACAILVSAGLQVAPIPADAYGLNLSAGLELAPGARLLHVCPSRHYPLGMTMPVSRRLEILAWARESEAWIVENDYDNEFRYSSQPLPAMASLDDSGRTIYLGTFSKSLAPGFRLSYLVAPPHLVAPMTKMAYLEQTLPQAIQRVLLRFIEEGHYARHVRRLRQAYQKREAALARSIREEASAYLVPRPMGSGFSFLVDLASGLDDLSVEASAARHGMTAYALSSYCFHGQPKPARQALVLGFACLRPEEMAGAVRRLCVAIEECTRN